MVAAMRVRAVGWSVAVIDFRLFGGTCALRGCDPKKMLVSGAEAIDFASRMRGHGVAGELNIDWPDLIAFKRSFTDSVPAKHERMYAAKRIETLHGHARFTGRNTMQVDDKVLEGRHFLIAAGAEPIKLGIPGEEHLATSEDFLGLERMPQRMVLVGGGYIAAEFSHIAARAGAKVKDSWPHHRPHQHREDRHRVCRPGKFQRRVDHGRGRYRRSCRRPGTGS